MSFSKRRINAFDGSSLTPATLLTADDRRGEIGARGANGFRGLIGAIGVLAVSGVIADIGALGITEASGEIGLYWGAAATIAMIEVIKMIWNSLRNSHTTLQYIFKEWMVYFSSGILLEFITKMLRLWNIVGRLDSGTLNWMGNGKKQFYRTRRQCG